MKLIRNKEPLPFLLIEDTFTEIESRKILKELEFLQPKLVNGHLTASAKNPDGTIKKKNKGIFLDEVYPSLRHVSDILTFNKKFYTPAVFKELEEIHPFYGVYSRCNITRTLVSYYENGGSYDPHSDNTVITICSWFYKEPKKFTGGVFSFPKYNIEIECKHNSTVIFFSCIEHAVSKVEIQDTDLECPGRFTVTQFLAKQF